MADMKQNRKTNFLSLIALISGILFFDLATAQELAIEGYSPVSYFTKNVAERGNSEFQAEFKGKIYYLSSAEQVRLFNENPNKYTPRFGEYCPYSLTHGERLPIDPTNFKIIGDSLLLFHRSETIDGREEWNKGNESEQLEAATGEFVLFTF